MGMYKNLKGVDHNVEINGYPFYAESISSNESFNRREVDRQSVMTGTEIITKGKYIPRSFTFTTVIDIKEGRADEFDKIFEGIVSKPAKVISPYMGGIMEAMVTIKKNAEAGLSENLTLEFTVDEIPKRKSNIIGESFKVPKSKTVDKK